MEPLLSIVVPCFNEEKALPAFFAETLNPIDQATGGAWQLIFVDDGSTDKSASVILSKHREDKRITCLRLSRNFGHQAALNCGLAYASAQYIGVMDCDLQDPVSVLAALFHKCSAEGYDIALGVRAKRTGNLFLRVCYRVFYRLMRRMSVHEWPLDAGDFCVFSKKVHRLLLSMPETVRVLRGLRSFVGLNQTSVSYARPSRKFGGSKYSLARLGELATSSLVSFSTAPLRLAVWIGLTMALFCFVLFVLLLTNRIFPEFSIFGYYIGANRGTATIGLLLCLIASMLFFCIGILGEYLGVILTEIKQRPSAIVQERIGDLPRQDTAFRVSEFQ